MRVLSWSSFRSTVPWIAGAIGALYACGPPESFDFITGGPPLPDAGEDAPLIEDRSLAPPRPLGPLSGSWVTTDRPHFRWELAGGGTGARIELCRSRACDGERKTFYASGVDYRIPEPLEPGMWFWRLATTTASTEGAPSKVSWELLVRGKPPGAAVDVTGPSGSIVDVDGDGFPDLLVSLDSQFGGGEILPEVATFRGTADPTKFEFIPSVITTIPLASSDVSFAVVDANGDGYSDIIFSEASQLVTASGGPSGVSQDRSSFVSTPTIEPGAFVREAGDMDGDGWGDVLVGTTTSVLGVFGTTSGLGPIQYFYFGPEADAGVPLDAGLGFPTAPLPVYGAFARNDDAFSDIALAEPLSEGPIFFLLGARERLFEAIFFDPSGALPSRATALAAGDFDGDGLADIAFTADKAGATNVCVVPGSADKRDEEGFFYLEAADVICWAAPTPLPAGFGKSLATGDLDADGRDELLVGSSSSGIWVLRLDGTKLSPRHLESPFGAKLTVVHPGRPGNAVWAASRADATEVAIFQGEEQVDKLVGADFMATKIGVSIR